MAFSIGQLAARLGVSSSALRYYETEGLVVPSGRRAGRRVYDLGALKQGQFVTRARSAGLKISEIRHLRALVMGVEPGSPECEKARQIAQAKVADLDRQIAEATALKGELLSALSQDCDPSTHCTVP